MSVCETFCLPVVEAEAHQVREVLRCLLHTILFTRALGMVVPREVESELLDISYVAVSDPEIEAVLEDRLSSICAAVERAPRTPSASQQPSLASSLSGAASKPVAAAVEQPSQVVLSFFERRQRAASGWWGPKEERLVWEAWVTNVRVLAPGTLLPPPGTSNGFNAQQAAGSPTTDQRVQGGTISRIPGLDAALTHITRCACDRRDHIPAVVSSASVPFSWDIAATSPPHGLGRPGFSLGGVKRMLLQTAPPPMATPG